MQPHEKWISKIESPITRERTKRKIARTYMVDDEICYGANEVYDKLDEMGYDLNFNQVNHLVNHHKLSKKNLEKYPELDPNNPKGLIKLLSRGQFYDSWVRRSTITDYMLIYYFEDPDHTRYYGTHTRTVNWIYRDFMNKLPYLNLKYNDLKDYVFNSLKIVKVEGNAKRAFDELDRAIYDYLIENPDYEAYNIDLMGYV